jgi:hypothetical protein
VGLARMANLIYYYVDETGKNTSSQYFIVCILAVEETLPYDKLCLEMEKKSGKSRKWTSSSHDRRMNYLQILFADETFVGRIYFSKYSSKVNYDLATIDTLTKVIEACKPLGKPRIFVDGLSATKVTEYSNVLKKRRIKFKKIKGIKKDANNPLIRLPDAVAGFLADALQGNNPNMNNQYKAAIRKKTLIEV